MDKLPVPGDSHVVNLEVGSSQNSSAGDLITVNFVFDLATPPQGSAQPINSIIDATITHDSASGFEGMAMRLFADTNGDGVGDVLLAGPAR